MLAWSLGRSDNLVQKWRRKEETEYPSRALELERRRRESWNPFFHEKYLESKDQIKLLFGSFFALQNSQKPNSRRESKGNWTHIFPVLIVIDTRSRQFINFQNQNPNCCTQNGKKTNFFSGPFWILQSFSSRLSVLLIKVWLASEKESQTRESGPKFIEREPERETEGTKITMQTIIFNRFTIPVFFSDYSQSECKNKKQKKMTSSRLPHGPRLMIFGRHRRQRLGAETQRKNGIKIWIAQRWQNPFSCSFSLSVS